MDLPEVECDEKPQGTRHRPLHLVPNDSANSGFPRPLDMLGLRQGTHPSRHSQLQPDIRRDTSLEPEMPHPAMPFQAHWKSNAWHVVSRNLERLCSCAGPQAAQWFSRPSDVEPRRPSIHRAHELLILGPAQERVAAK